MQQTPATLHRLPKCKIGDRVYVTLASGACTGHVLGHHEHADGYIAYTVRLECNSTIVTASEDAVERIIKPSAESSIALGINPDQTDNWPPSAKMTPHP